MESILIVEDEKEIRELLTELLGEEGYEIHSTSDGNKAVDIFNRVKPDLVLLDIILPGMDGIRILERIRRMKEEAVVIMISGSQGISNAVEAMKLGAYDYLTKPLNNDELLITIQKALHEHFLNQEVKLLRKRLNDRYLTERKMGDSAGIRNVLKQVELVAPTGMSVIIEGKSGTGKEVIARLIHQKSARKNKPLIAVDSGAIPETLVESELFGYEKGAFTGATSAKQGKFELAHKGTLLLDEITNLPLESQAKLLRALEENKIHRIGAKKPASVDVRIIATSNIDFGEAVEKGLFREDLYHRINEFRIILPELKDRKSDIPVLARDFLIEANAELNKNLEGFSKKALEDLMNYRWPGNVRELKNTVKRAVLLAKGRFIESGELAFPKETGPDSSCDFSGDNPISMERTLKSIEREMIVKALDHTGGNKSKAAYLLGIDRKSLYRKLTKLGLEHRK